MGEAKIPIFAHGMVNKAAFSTLFGFGCTIYHLNKGDVSNIESAFVNAEHVATDIVQELKNETGIWWSKSVNQHFHLLDTLSGLEPMTKAFKRERRDIEKLPNKAERVHNML
ncbi:hypothetical protein X471_01154 [Bartonella bacilliformis str. Heidi Mejia]|uniref:hypothetical protein n=1 Tax=Bartonella bacilliformis TaxID=774 RepID=UPI0004518B7F|nr:hypothetical protein [Bartonella bacilliformis]EYS91019.1 hypothetical protein X471_01154 [Bartonella bacilliformis str. Heidi Mejia]KEG17952.1 hypothetical protein H707_01037 [Bartonella bacilliformis Hosp800-02]KEG21788.1 hypothetical protein H708_01041 [Bartonella bacilliformis VAB9028]KEG23163.1 hypothetical protein H706_01051 [Bartonella bacilliformis CAR600-02]